MRTQHISRRVVLKGLAATVALPWLESLSAVAGGQPARNTPPKRFAFMFFGDGIHPAEWWSRGNGATMELGPAFASLDRLKNKVNFVHGLRHPGNVCDGPPKGAPALPTRLNPNNAPHSRPRAHL